MSQNTKNSDELDVEMAFVQKKIVDGLARKEKELEARHSHELEALRLAHHEKLADIDREHNLVLDKLERDLREKARAEMQERSEKLSNEFAEEFSKQEQLMKAQLASEKKAIEEELRHRADSDLARDKRDLEEMFQTRLRKREEDLKERLEKDIRAREAEIRRAVDLEYRQMQSESQAKLEEEMQSRLKEMKASEQEESRKALVIEKARLDNETTRKIETEVARLDMETRQKIIEAEAALKERFASSMEQERHKIEEEIKDRLLRRGRYSRLSRALKGVLFPFPAMVGLEKAKRALLLNAINQNIGGVVLWGREGNGKFTLILTFAEMLSPIEKVLVGREEDHKSWNDAERYMTGRIHYGGEMAVYLIDTYLQCAALSLPNIPPRHAAESKEPTDLPPLLLSSLKDEDEQAYHIINGFTLHVEVSSPSTVEERLEIMRRNSEHRKDPVSFRERYTTSIEETVANVRSARDHLPSTTMSTKILALIARMTILDKQSSRLDVLMELLARTNAAFEGRTDVDTTDVMEAADLALMHRLTPRDMADIERTMSKEPPPARFK